MGQARKRGSYESRKQSAIARDNGMSSRQSKRPFMLFSGRQLLQAVLDKTDPNYKLKNNKEYVTEEVLKEIDLI